MKIYANESPATIARSGRPWSVLRSLIDPVIIVGTYLGILAFVRKPWAEADFLVILLALVLTYPGKVPFNRFSAHIAFAILSQWFWVLVVLLLFRWAIGTEHAPIFSVWGATAPLVLLGIHWLSPVLAPYLRCFYKQSKVVIVGANEIGWRFFELIRRGEADGQNVIGFFDDREAHRLDLIGPHLLKGRIDEVSGYVKRHGIDVIYIALPMSSQRRVVSLLEQLRETRASIYFIPDIFVADLIQARVDTVGGVPLVSVCDTPFQGMPGAIKRAFDLILTLLALPLLLPVLGLVALLIRLTSPGPVIFKQRRYGLDGREILVWKFRTMKTLEDGDKTYHQVTRDDDRVTPLGRLLRKTSLDELPQLLNVLAGNMSLVGPRPHALAVNEQFRKLIPGYMVRHKVKPGITGWAQVNGCRGGDDLESMRRRTEYDLEYLRSWCLTLDLVIIWKTARLLIVGDEKAY
ncbi:undecaprenyl-phosphate glucose phosphotransferase [Caenimonas soli]|uniref:undecaprenyl-phosphate glucose phosphotransferase n=1 Tax=Caenimonas soli TaxID=2735555 RepID=UPI001553418C|nr:undecaprenyl-phosphate glucose phosphotransferase [Caenimonas soli]NPC57479.1 undecaprenyl-phosphate glucose phosphotransferase [Caenimonas soli]